MIIEEQFEYEEVKAFKFGYHPFGQPNMFVHIYYVDGLLIDTGQSRAAKAVLNQIGQLDVEQIFITHHHEDHTGNLAQLKSHFNCPTYSSDLCSKLMQKPPAISLAQQLIWGSRPPFKHLQPKEDKLYTKNFTFDIIPIPGHAIDMVALFEPNKKWLFSADLYVNSYISYFLKNESVKEQIESIKKLLKLDFEVLFCGHTPLLTNGKKQLQKKLLFLTAFYEKVATLHQQKLNAGEIFKKLNFKEKWFIRLASHGHLSKMNMVKAVIRDIQAEQQKH